jgi:predicted nuclease with TOPRIM domain
MLNKFEVKNIWDEKNISHFVQKINNSSVYVSEFFSSLSNLTNSEITIFEIKKIMEECRLKLHETLKDRSAPQLELVSQALSSNTQINTPIHSYIREYRNKIEEQFQKIRKKSRFHTKMEKLEVYGHLPSIRLELRKLLKLLGSYLRFRRDEKSADDEVELGLIIGFSKTQEKETINRTRKKKKALRSESITKRTRFRANSI